MTVTADSILNDLRGDLTAFEADSPRAKQTETGASQLYGCTAEAIYRLRGTPGTERLSWPAVVGKAIHEYLATARPKVRDGVICEQRFVYRNVPASVDYLDPAQALLVDYKSKDDVDDIETLLTNGPSTSQVAQVHLGAAAAREAGYPVEWVALVVLPRSGELDDARVFGPWPFDQQQADDAATWASDVDSLAADPDVDPRDHRGKPAFWCFAYCPFAEECRGERPADVDLDELAVPAEAYREAQDQRDAAEEQMKALRPLIFGAKGRAGRVTITTSNGSTRPVDVDDIDALRELYLFVNGEDAPLPTKTVEKTTASRLTVKWAKS